MVVPGGAPLVAGTIDLDGERCRMAEEVEHERADRMLAPELGPSSAATKQRPQRDLGLGHALPERSCALGPRPDSSTHAEVLGSRGRGLLPLSFRRGAIEPANALEG